MLRDGDLMGVELNSPVGSNIEGGIHAVPVGVLWGVIRVGESKRPANLQVTSSCCARRGLSQRKRGARSQHSEDEDSSFQRVVSIWPGYWIVSSSSVVQVGPELPTIFKDIHMIQRLMVRGIRRD